MGMGVPEEGGVALCPALVARSVSAAVVDVDHCRPHFGVSLETDYIIEVRSTSAEFDTFRISKTYSAVRTLASDLRRAAKLVRSTETDGSAVSGVTRIAQSVSVLVDKEAGRHLGRVSYSYAKFLAKQRRSIIDIALCEVLEHGLAGHAGRDRPVVRTFFRAVESFLLTDHVVEEDDERALTPVSGVKRKVEYALTPVSGVKKKVGRLVSKLGKAPRARKLEVDTSIRTEAGPEPDGLISPSVIPVSRRSRRPESLREKDEQMLQAKGDDLVLEDEQVLSVKRYSSPSPSVSILDSPLAFVVLLAAAVAILIVASRSTMTAHFDVALLFGVACYSLGIHSAKPAKAAARTNAATAAKSPPSRSGREKQTEGFLRKSLMKSIPQVMPDGGVASMEGEHQGTFADNPERLGDEPEISSPMRTFPVGAELGTVMNCVSEPIYTDFKIRGPNYLVDRRKIPSAPFLFPLRGVDLFLTDLAPEHVGRNTGVMGGRLRDVPTMIINFRLPWGVLLYYFRIPTKLLPFLRARHDPAFDKSKLPSMDDYTGSEKSAARYLMGDDAHRNETLKIIPVVVKGPWVCRSVAGGKPAIIATKMPAKYIYEPAASDEGKAEYLEVDLDIVASSAARGILSVVRPYTSILTMDLGFVIQGNQQDELPEQMLVGARLHSIDVLSCPPLPPMKDMFIHSVLEAARNIESVASMEEE